jgi:predicted nucleic acid-binding protein
MMPVEQFDRLAVRAGRRVVSGFLLDTDCVSELVRVKPEPRVLEWMEAADESLLYLSVLTLGDLRKGLAALGCAT